MTATAATTAPAWATSTTSTTSDGTTTTHTAVVAREDSFEVGLSRTDDAEGPSETIVTVSADFLEPADADLLAAALTEAAAKARA